MEKNQVIQVLKEVKEVAKKKYRVEVKGFFGSYLRGEESEKSDVDILVQFDEKADLLDLVGLSFFLEEKLHKPVDIVPQDALRQEIKSSILKEAYFL